jgi:uncharacterized radical SAM superfamily Fe-S cluster-containing enzyme
LEAKLSALKNLAEAELAAVLVPTVVRGLNDLELGAMIRFAAAKPWVRGIHFQPMTASGRNNFKGAERRLTLPELLTHLATQAPESVDINKAFPPACEHERCSFHLRFKRLDDGTLIPKTALASNLRRAPNEDKATGDTMPAENGESRDRAVDIILRSWAPAQSLEPSPLTPGFPKPPIPIFSKKKDAFDQFLEQAARQTFSLTAMFFQDAWSMDLERLKGCCVHVFDPPDRFVPFCAMNLTSADGRPLYRGRGEVEES